MRSQTDRHTDRQTDRHTHTHTHTQTRVTIIHFASSTTHVKCNNPIALKPFTLEAYTTAFIGDL